MATRSTAAGLRHPPRFTQILPTLGMTNDLSIATTSSRGRPSRFLRSPRREACGSTGAPSFPPQPSRRLGWWALAWRAVCTRQPAIQIPTDWSSVFPLPEGWFTSCEPTTGAVPGTIALKANVPMGIVTLTEPGGARPTLKPDRAPFSLDLAQAPPGRKLARCNATVFYPQRRKPMKQKFTLAASTFVLAERGERKPLQGKPSASPLT